MTTPRDSFSDLNLDESMLQELRQFIRSADEARAEFAKFDPLRRVLERYGFASEDVHVRKPSDPYFWRLLEEFPPELKARFRIPSDLYIRRSLEFPPELKDAAISILAYFNNILLTKYPGVVDPRSWLSRILGALITGSKLAKQYALLRPLLTLSSSVGRTCLGRTSACG
jgi:hypothetical protein